jgi:hypothetical protein
MRAVLAFSQSHMGVVEAAHQIIDSCNFLICVNKTGLEMAQT